MSKKTEKAVNSTATATTQVNAIATATTPAVEKKQSALLSGNSAYKSETCSLAHCVKVLAKSEHFTDWRKELAILSIEQIWSVVKDQIEPSKSGKFSVYRVGCFVQKSIRQAIKEAAKDARNRAAYFVA